MGSQSNSHPWSVIYNKVCTVWRTNCLKSIAIEQSMKVKQTILPKSRRCQQRLLSAGGERVFWGRWWVSCSEGTGAARARCRSPLWPTPTVTAECLQCQRVPARGSELLFLTKVVMIHLLMEVLGLNKEEGEDATWRGRGREAQKTAVPGSRLKPCTKLI